MSKMEIQANASKPFDHRAHRQHQLERIKNFVPLGILFIFFIGCSIISDDFLTRNNLLTLLDLASLPLIIALSSTLVVIIGSINLSIEGMMGLSGAIISMLALNNRTVFNLGIFAVLIAVAVSGFVGFLIVLIMVHTKIPSFMVTFCMGLITTGAALIMYGGKPGTLSDMQIRSIALNKFLGVPIYFYIALLVFLIAWLIQSKTAFGRQIYAVGQDENSAAMAGINVNRVKITVFTLAGLIIGIAGFVSIAQFARADMSNVMNKSFPALAAIVLGGTNLSGGRGGVVNTLVGVTIITMLTNIMVLLSVNAYVRDAAQGVFLLIIMVAFGWSKKNKKLIVK